MIAQASWRLLGVHLKMLIILYLTGKMLEYSKILLPSWVIQITELDDTKSVIVGGMTK